MKIRCPKCDQALKAPKAVIGRKVKCVRCKYGFIVQPNDQGVKKDGGSRPARKGGKGLRKSRSVAPGSSMARRSQKRARALPIVLLMLAILVGVGALVWFGRAKPNTQSDDSGQGIALEKNEENPVLKVEGQHAGKKKADEPELDSPDSASKGASEFSKLTDASLFDTKAWQVKYGQVFSTDEWCENNPHPFAKRFDPRLSYMLPRYFINLGPLGVRTWMHDQNWAHRYPAALKKFPKVLVDEHGVIQNAFEIIHVQKKGPAFGHLQAGDLILEMEGEPIKSSQWTYLNKEITIKGNRSLEMHAGQQIDRAEGRGAIKLKVLRLPEKNLAPASGDRSWVKRKSAELELKVGVNVSISLKNVNILKISGDTYGKGHGGILFDGAHLVDDRGVEVSLWDLERIVFKNAWGKVAMDKATKSWRALAPFEFQFGIPPGDWTFQGKVTASSKALGVEVSTLERGRLHEKLLPYVKTVKFKIPQIGSFGATFDPDSAKVQNYSAILARRLAVQQLPDGSWPNLKGLYVRPEFFTSMCGLGLMATGDPAHDDHVRKAAHYVAYSGEFSNWSYTRGLAAMFLGEYYLRSNDETILPGLSLALKRAEEFLLVGYIAGHHASPGYGGGGWIGGSGAIACAFAIAEHTPASFTRGTASKMLERIQSLAIRGTIPYGRSTGNSARKKVFDLNLRWSGQGGSAGTAPFLMAAKINGGSKFFTEIVTRRFTSGPYGDVDYGHGTHTLPFTVGSIAISLCGAQAHKDNMEAFLWKLTTHRGFDGLIVNNANPLEFHSGESVMGKPWWNTGAYLVMLNSHKHNLAITGKPEYMAKDFVDLPLVHDIDMKVWRQTLRQWCTVEAALGTKTPSTVKRAVRELEALKKDANLGVNVFAFMDRRALECARAVSSAPVKDKQLKNYCMEILLGVNHDIHLDESNWNRSDSDKRKLAKEAKAKGKEDEYRRKAVSLELEINSHTFFAMCNGVLADKKHSDNPLPKLASEGTVTFKDERGRPVKGLPKAIPLTHDNLKQNFTIPDGQDVEKLHAHFSYRCGGVNIDYVREIKVNRKNGSHNHFANIRRIWIPGELIQSFNGWNIHFRLPNGIVYHGSTNNQKPQIFDIKGERYPYYILRWGPMSENIPVISSLAKGHHGMFLVSFGTAWEGSVHEIRIENPLENQLETSRLSCSQGEIQEEEKGYDSNPHTYAKVVMDDQGVASIDVELRKKNSAASLYRLATKHKNDDVTYKVETNVGPEWIKIAWGSLRSRQTFVPLVDCPQSNRFRIIMNGKPNREIKLYELHLFK